MDMDIYSIINTFVTLFLGGGWFLHWLASRRKANGEAKQTEAQADKAYMNEMNLTPSQFIQLRAWDIIDKKQGANVDVLFNGSADAIWNIRR